MKLKVYVNIYPWTTEEGRIFSVFHEPPMPGKDAKTYAVEFEVPDLIPKITGSAVQVTEWDGGEENAY